MATEKNRSTNADRKNKIKGWFKTYIKSMAIVIPLICFGALAVIRLTAGFWDDPVEFFIIGICCGTVSFWGTVFTREIQDKLLLRLGRPVSSHGAAGNFLITAAFLYPGLYVGFHAVILKKALYGQSLSYDSINWKPGFVIALIAVILVFILESRSELRLGKKEAEIRLKKTEIERLHAQLNALSSQTSPHMLFNALNTIASLIHSKPDTAEEMTVELADLLRSILDASRKKHHTLAEELTLVENYLQIEKKRFGERLDLTWNVNESPELSERSVPALILQPLVENAVKYAVAPRANGGSICVSAKVENDILEVSIEDDGPGPNRSKALPGAGIGIKNCSRRLELAYGGGASLAMTERPSGGTQVLVCIPSSGIFQESENPNNGVLKRKNHENTGCR